MRLTLPDEILDPYQAYAERQGRPLEDVLIAQLLRFQALEPGRKAIVIQANAVASLETALGGMPIVDSDDLLRRLRKSGQVTFESVDIGLTETQKLELQHRAARQGRTVTALVMDIWRDLQQNFFWSSGGGPAKAPTPVPPSAPRAS